MANHGDHNNKNSTNPRPRATIGEPWDDFHILREEHEIGEETDNATDKDSRMRAWLVKYTTLLIAFLIFVSLLAFAMLTNDKEHLDEAWELSVLLLATLGLRSRS